MPQRAEEIRRAHLTDVVRALLAYVEAGHEISFVTEHLGQDSGQIAFTIDLSAFHPLLQDLTARRCPDAPTPEVAAAVD